MVGTIGSGKSNLLLALLGELQAQSGVVHRHGRISYASQVPWIFAATLKDNVTLAFATGCPVDAARYAAVLHCCCLEDDLAALPAGDGTPIGERGVNLSGGQRARVSLARALYALADVYLLDDVLSAVDARTSRAVFERAVCGFLAGKTRVLVTHALQFVKAADQVVVLAQGAVAASSTFADLSARAAEARAEAEPGAESVDAAYLKQVFAECAELEQAAAGDAAAAAAAATAAVDAGASPVAAAAAVPGSGEALPASASEVVVKVAGAGRSLSFAHTEALAKGAVSAHVYRRLYRAVGGLPVTVGLAALLLLGVVVPFLTNYTLAWWARLPAAEQGDYGPAAVFGGLVALFCFVSFARAIAFFLGGYFVRMLCLAAPLPRPFSVFATAYIRCMPVLAQAF